MKRSIIICLSAPLLLIGCATSPYSTGSLGTPTVSVGVGSSPSNIPVGTTSTTGAIITGGGRSTSIADIAAAIIIGQTIPQYPGIEETPQPEQPASNTRIIRDEEPPWASHEDREELSGTVADVLAYQIDSQRKEKNRKAADDPNFGLDDIDIIESDSDILDASADRDIQGVLVKLDDGTEITALNSIYATLEEGDRVLVRVYKTPRAKRNTYRIIRKLDLNYGFPSAVGS